MPSDRQQLEDRLDRIKEIMELATEYKLLPDWAAIVGGTMILIATLITYRLTGSWDVAAVFRLGENRFWLVAAMWSGSVLASILLYYVIALRDAKKLGVSLESRPSQLARRSMAPALFASAVITLRLLLDGHLGYLPGIWILGYGVALVNAGLFSTTAPRILGLLFMAVGTAAIVCFQRYDLALTGLTFGAFHVAFGCYVLSKKSA
ncbi:MAG: hypothetical protein HY925_04720 [Elusimicrobia bacterium]|nr:hypothetical protein [Elusimicrobiota bacterium]